LAVAAVVLVMARLEITQVLAGALQHLALCLRLVVLVLFTQQLVVAQVVAI
jgi:hypothetical protein